MVKLTVLLFYFRSTFASSLFTSHLFPLANEGVGKMGSTMILLPACCPQTPPYCPSTSHLHKDGRSQTPQLCSPHSATRSVPAMSSPRSRLQLALPSRQLLPLLSSTLSHKNQSNDAQKPQWHCTPKKLPPPLSYEEQHLPPKQTHIHSTTVNTTIQSPNHSQSPTTHHYHTGHPTTTHRHHCDTPRTSSFQGPH